MSKEAFVSLSEALDMAYAEGGEAEPAVAEETSPVSEVQAEPEVEQAEDAENEQVELLAETQEAIPESDELFTEELLEDLEQEAPSIPGDDTEFPEGWLPGVDGSITLRELRDGYLRQADYTRGKQALAEQRKQFEATSGEALRFWEALTKDAEGVVRSLAMQAGLIPEDGHTPKMDLSPLRTAEQVEAEVERRVAERLEQHPEVVAAREREAIAAVESEFTRIETALGITLGPRSREVILREAQRRQTVDLELVASHLMAAQQRRAEQANRVRDAAPTKASPRASEEDITDRPVTSVEDAFKRAELEMSRIAG